MYKITVCRYEDGSSCLQFKAFKDIIPVKNTSWIFLFKNTFHTLYGAIYVAGAF